MASPAATPRTIRARWTWNQGRDRLRAISCKIGASWGAIFRGRGLRPRMGRLRWLDPVVEPSVPAVANFLHYFVPGTLDCFWSAYVIVQLPSPNASAVIVQVAKAAPPASFRV